MITQPHLPFPVIRQYLVYLMPEGVRVAPMPQMRQFMHDDGVEHREGAIMHGRFSISIGCTVEEDGGRIQCSSRGTLPLAQPKESKVAFRLNGTHS